MIRPHRTLILAHLLLLLWMLAAPSAAEAQDGADFTAIFDTHWETLRDDYAYFELYGVDWEAERAAHRPAAIAAENETEFAWEMARLLSVLPDRHLSWHPPLERWLEEGRGWSIPAVRTARIEGARYVIAWPDGQTPTEPAEFVDDPHAYPEVLRVGGEPPSNLSIMLVAGPPGTTCELDLRWPDGTETTHALRRPDQPNMPPADVSFEDEWIVSGRFGDIAYLGVRSFSTRRASVETIDEMSDVLAETLEELGDTEKLILDFQGNGGGAVQTSDPFLGHFLKRTKRYRWGGGGGTRVVRPRRPRYIGEVVVLVDGGSGSGGEWAARILRDAGRAVVVGARTAGAEAAVHESRAEDGSKIAFSAWPMIQRGITPFQETGIQLDHAIELTLKQARTLGFEEAADRARRQRFDTALQLLDARGVDLDALLVLAELPERNPFGARDDEETVTEKR